MALRELIEQWNTVMPTRISEQQLLSPNELFLMDCLTNIFAKINKAVPINLKAKDEELCRLAKLDMCADVNSLYKLSDKKNEFFYFDLIEPSPKRTLHLQQNLLNYVLYYDMVKDKVFMKSKESGHHMEELTTRRQDLQTRIEKKKIINRMKEEEELALRVEDNEVDGKMMAEKMKHSGIKQGWNMWQEKVKQLEEEIRKLDIKVQMMQNELIPYDKIEKMQEDIAYTQKETEKLKATNDSDVASSTAATATNEKIHLSIKKTGDLLQQLRDFIEKKTLEKNIFADAQKIINELQLQLTSEAQAVGELRNIEESEKIKISQSMQRNKELVRESVKLLKDKEANYKNLKDKYAEKMQKLAELKAKEDDLKYEIEEGEIAIQKILKLMD
ncbi:uncharacterized protein LOC129793604 [Lutzomyia longipalpis]|uniref:uncharacterized protein LOC129793604 n=1 Tax=Lutzomyia longipalpis TaxID=7200 RepID=UPI002483A646|nr:uncharacterized protein LOC129793604 [Lutzomyia longipalpis]